MPRKKKAVDETPSLLDITAKLRSGPCVPALREAVKIWQAGGRKGITDTTRILLNNWFSSDHKLKTGRPFKYHDSQQEAIETLIYVWEVEKVRTRKDLLERYAQNVPDLRLAQYDELRPLLHQNGHRQRQDEGDGSGYCMAILQRRREQDDIAKDYAKTFLLIAPNVIVLERLKGDFANGNIFPRRPDPSERIRHLLGLRLRHARRGRTRPLRRVLFLTNIQQFYERPDRGKDEEPDVMTAVLGPKAPAQKLEQSTSPSALRAAGVAGHQRRSSPHPRRGHASGTTSSARCMKKRRSRRSSISPRRRASRRARSFRGQFPTIRSSRRSSTAS